MLLFLLLSHKTYFLLSPIQLLMFILHLSYFIIPLKADSHIACRAHAAPMPFPCHAMPLRVYNVSFSFDLHSAAVSDSHMPCHAHAAPMPCSDHAGLLKAKAQHGRRETTCGLPARFRLLPATPRSYTKLLSEA
jgi:hypothetical protein